MVRPQLDPEFLEVLGPIAPLVSRPDISEVMVMGDRDVYIEVNGVVELTDIKFSSEPELVKTIEAIVHSVGRDIGPDSPLCDARLPDGSRVHAAVRPVAVDGPMLTIRKFIEGPDQPETMIRIGTASTEVMAYMRLAVEAKANIVITGGTAVGKTTLLNVVSGFIPEGERIVTIEDAAELHLHQRHVGRLETMTSSTSGRNPITIRELVITSLRMRPDRIVVGECRGAEALDMMQAMNTGHDGSLTTIHANSPRDALSRIENMVLMAGYDIPVKAIRSQMAAAFTLTACATEPARSCRSSRSRAWRARSSPCRMSSGSSSAATTTTAWSSAGSRPPRCGRAWSTKPASRASRSRPSC
jgi:pilus assembly protein CpaF